MLRNSPGGGVSTDYAFIFHREHYGSFGYGLHGDNEKQMFLAAAGHGAHGFERRT